MGRECVREDEGGREGGSEGGSEGGERKIEERQAQSLQINEGPAVCAQRQTHCSTQCSAGLQSMPWSMPLTIVSPE